jgi:hypothetical protein
MSRLSFQHEAPMSRLSFQHLLLRCDIMPVESLPLPRG